jgi:flavin-dependent dehydrogenase
MGKVYDVAIVGAGFAGLSVASELSGSGLKVLLVEKNKKLCVNENPVRGTFKETAKNYEVEDSIIKEYGKVCFYGTESKASLMPKDKICLFGSEKMLNILKEKADCEIKTDYEITYAKRNNGIKLIGANNEEISAKIAVDASGRNSVVANSLNISKSRVYCKCYISLLSNCSLNPDEISYFCSNKISNASAWVEPLSKNKCQLGIANFEPYSMLYKDDLRRNAMYMMKVFKASKRMLSESKIINGSEKCISYPVEPIDNMYGDNLLVIGDAAGQASPLFGEGVRACFEMAKICSQTIKDAFSREDFSAKFLRKYEAAWWESYGQYTGWGVFLRHYVAKHFKNEDWNMIIQNLEKLSSEEKEDFIKSRINYPLFQKLSSFYITNDMLQKKLKELLPNFSSLRQRYFVSHFV